MNEPYTLTPTTRAVAAILHAEHNLRVYGSYSNPDGTCPMGNGDPEMMTLWSINGTHQPILQTITTWKLDKTQPPNKRVRIDEESKYWLCVAMECCDDAN